MGFITHWYDIVNALFELAGGIFVWLNVAAIRRDKGLKGIRWEPQLVFTIWGFWNIFYYQHLGQVWSAAASVSVVLANGAWLWFVWKYWIAWKQYPSTYNLLYKEGAPLSSVEILNQFVKKPANFFFSTGHVDAIFPKYHGDRRFFRVSGTLEIDEENRRRLRSLARSVVWWRMDLFRELEASLRRIRERFDKAHGVTVIHDEVVRPKLPDDPIEALICGHGFKYQEGCADCELTRGAHRKANGICEHDCRVEYCWICTSSDRLGKEGST